MSSFVLKWWEMCLSRGTVGSVSVTELFMLFLGNSVYGLVCGLWTNHYYKKMKIT